MTICANWLLTTWCPLLLCTCLTRSGAWRPSDFKAKSSGLCSGQGPNAFLCIQTSILSNQSISSTVKPPQLLPLPFLFITYPFSLLSASFLRTHVVHTYLSIFTFWPSKRKMEFFFEISADPVLGTGRRQQIRVCIIHSVGKVRTMQCKTAVEWGCWKQASSQRRWNRYIGSMRSKTIVNPHKS